jgi:hypothetical protein
MKIQIKRTIIIISRGSLEMGNCSGFCMTSNQATNAGEETTHASKKVITADVVRSALQERVDMMKDDGMAGAAQYEEAYGGQGYTRGAGNSLMNGNTAMPRKMNYAGAPSGQYPDGRTSNGEGNINGQREILPSMTLPSGAIYNGEWLNGMKDGFGT